MNLSKLQTHLQENFYLFCQEHFMKKRIEELQNYILGKKLKQIRNSDNKNAKMQHFNILFDLQSNKPKFKCYENQMNRTSLLELQAHTTH